jgi:hypothetical protein
LTTLVSSVSSTTIWSGAYGRQLHSHYFYNTDHLSTIGVGRSTLVVLGEFLSVMLRPASLVGFSLFTSIKLPQKVCHY